MKDPILTAAVAHNSDIFPLILELYVPEGCSILDMTFGKGRFWKKVPPKWFLRALDIEPINPKNLPWECESRQTDSTQYICLPRTWSAVVIDPPYAQGSTSPRKDPLAKEYNLGVVSRIEDILPIYEAMLQKAFICLVDNGVAIVKCQDLINGGKQHWFHMNVFNIAVALGFEAEDLFVVVQKNRPIMRHNYQLHARKNHSYFWVFRKR